VATNYDVQKIARLHEIITNVKLLNLFTVAKKTLFGEAFDSKNGWSLGERLAALALSPLVDTSNAIGNGLKKIGFDLSDSKVEEWEIRTP